MKKLMILAAMLMVFGMVGSASANLITNGDFETGDLTGWTTGGDVKVTDDGGVFASAQGMDNYYALLGLGITDGESKLKQNIDVTGLSELTISFNWAFDYWDNSVSAEDTFISLIKEDTKVKPVKITLLDLQTNGTGFFSPDGGLAHGYYMDTIDISAFTLDEGSVIFTLTEESDTPWYTGTASMAGIDNVSVAGDPVPEPATMLLLASGLFGLAGFRRKFKK